MENHHVVPAKQPINVRECQYYLSTFAHAEKERLQAQMQYDPYMVSSHLAGEFGQLEGP